MLKSMVETAASSKQVQKKQQQTKKTRYCLRYDNL